MTGASPTWPSRVNRLPVTTRSELDTDTTVPCSTIMTAYTGITNQPVMLASYLAADHANWISFGNGTAVKPVEVTVTAWMRVHLMGDTANRKYFYGPSCTFCTDSRVKVEQNSLIAQ